MVFLFFDAPVTGYARMKKRDALSSEMHLCVIYSNAGGWRMLTDQHLPQHLECL